ncbi:MAG: hypothetical protein EOP83_35285 [Verrucomicrobiaceae bacterium]|nr:MAG: hypothetical protein EOP83_35285 [Verrucomicrobiaceae bacterium]
MSQDDVADEAGLGLIDKLLAAKGGYFFRQEEVSRRMKKCEVILQFNVTRRGHGYHVPVTFFLDASESVKAD